MTELLEPCAGLLAAESAYGVADIIGTHAWGTGGRRLWGRVRDNQRQQDKAKPTERKHEKKIHALLTSKRSKRALLFIFPAPFKHNPAFDRQCYGIAQYGAGPAALCAG